MEAAFHRATDAQLWRDVAIEFLPAAFTADEEADGVRALVMELVA